jgi:hypothetical protein
MKITIIAKDSQEYKRPTIEILYYKWILSTRIVSCIKSSR